MQASFKEGQLGPAWCCAGSKHVTKYSVSPGVTIPERRAARLVLGAQCHFYKGWLCVLTHMLPWLDEYAPCSGREGSDQALRSSASSGLTSPQCCVSRCSIRKLRGEAVRETRETCLQLASPLPGLLMVNVLQMDDSPNK